MRSTILSFLLILLCGGTLAQKTQTEVLRSVDPEADTKPNSAEVPDVVTQKGDFERILVLRFKHDVDLLEGLNQAVRSQGIKNAVILSGIGSARGYHYHVVSNRDFPSKNYFIKDPTHPADICNMNGYIVEGRVHAHITFSDDEKAFGGHLEPETRVFTFAIVTVGVLSDSIDLFRADDKAYR
jgi:predicted DNA-binding protein with PD1-like motif